MSTYIAKGNKWRDRNLRHRATKSKRHMLRNQKKSKRLEKGCYEWGGPAWQLCRAFVKGRRMDKQPSGKEMVIADVLAAGPWRTVKAHKPMTTKRAGRPGMWVRPVAHFLSFSAKF